MSTTRRLLVCVVITAASALAWGETSVPEMPRAPASRAEELQRLREQKSKNLVPPETSRLENWFLNIEKRTVGQSRMFGSAGGFKPLWGGMPSGSGLAVGARFNRDSGKKFEFAGDARVSSRGSTMFSAGITIPAPRADFPVRGFVRIDFVDMKALNYYGIGPDPDSGKGRHYETRDRSLEAGVDLAPGKRLRAGGGAEWLHVDAGSERPLDQNVTPEMLQPIDFVVYRGRVAFDLHDESAPQAGASMTLGVERYDDRKADSFDFTRWTAEFQAHVPIKYRNRMVAFRFLTAHDVPSESTRVPFFLMETLGGAKTLRGYTERRFRDTRSLLLNLEYRWEVWSYADLCVFADAGKVFSRADDLDFHGLEFGKGIGLRFRSIRGTIFRMDIAHGGDGVRLHIDGGPKF